MLRRTITRWIRERPVQFAIGSVTASTTLGVIAFALIVPTQPSGTNCDELTEGQALLQAMLETTRDMSWKDNLDLARGARDRFFQVQDPQPSKQIDRIYHRQQVLLSRQRQRKQSAWAEDSDVSTNDNDTKFW